MKRIIVLAIFYSVWLSVSHAATYWVSKSGDDGNSCNDSATPLTTTAKQTIQGGFRCLTGGGQTLRVRAGTYSERFKFNGVANGTSWSNAITVEANPGETVIWEVPSDAVQALIWDSSYFILRGFIFDGTKGKNCLHLNGGSCNPGSPPPGPYTTIPVSGAQNFLELGGHHQRIENNEFHHSAYGVAFFNTQADGAEFINNYVHHICKVTNCNPLYIKAPNVLVDGNRFVNTACGPIAFWNADTSGLVVNNGIARNNYIERAGYFWATDNGTRLDTGKQVQQGDINLSCGQAIGVSRGSGTAVYNNVVVNSAGGIWLNYNAQNCLVYNNTIYGNSSAGVGGDSYNSGIVFGDTAGGASNCIARNNIVYQPGITNPPPIIDLGTGNDLSDNFCSSSATGCDLVGDPKFVDAANRDFHLQDDSPTKDKGKTISIVTHDLDGVPRPQGGAYDIGVYEFRSSGAHTYTLSTPKSSYSPGEAISVSWTVSPAPGNPKDWIGFYLSSNADNKKFISTDGGGHQAWTYTNGKTAGTFTITAPSAPGTYEFRYLLNDGYTEVEASPKISNTTSSVLLPPPHFRIIP